MLRGSDLLQLWLAPVDLVGGNGKFSSFVKAASLLVRWWMWMCFGGWFSSPAVSL